MQIGVTKPLFSLSARLQSLRRSLDGDTFTLADDSTCYRSSSVRISFDSKCCVRDIDDQPQLKAMNEAR